MTARLRYVLALLLALLCVGPAAAQGADEFFKGKTVTIYVGFGPGGGYDAYAQLLAQHIGRHIPGHPTVIVKHMPGGGSLVMLNYLANVAARDGTAFGIPAGQAAFSPLIGSPEEKKAARFEATKLGWLGSLEQFTALGLVWHTTGLKMLDDVKTREITFGSTGASSGGEFYAQLLNDMLGTKLKPIRGFRGSNDITLAMERGEIDGFVGWCWTCMKADRPQYLNDKLVNVFVQIGLEHEPEMAGVPSLLDLIADPKDRQVAKLMLANLAISRPFVAPPGLPPERLATLREAFNQTAADPAFLADAVRTKRVISLYKGEQIDALLKESYALPPDIIKRASDIATPSK